MNVLEVFPSVLVTVWGIEVRDTVVVTWGVMFLIIVVSGLAVRRLRVQPGSFQAAAEAVVEVATDLIKSSSAVPPGRLLPFVGTLGLFLLTANTIGAVPYLGAPTKDLSTAASLAVVVFAAVHYFGFRIVGFRKYLSGYVDPHWLLLPFNIIGEVTRTIALALRLFGNMISGELVVAVLFVIAGFLLPVPLQILGLLIGVIQAYVFTLLAMVYIAAALQVRSDEEPTP